MNKFLVSLALVSSLSISSLIATESSTLNKTDSELLFGTAQNVNVEVLSENEMKETKGEFVDGLVLTATIIGGVAAGFEVYDRVKSWFD
ncbi:hypothetical protein Hc94105_1760 [Helicobacter cinaedi]|uniref:hypothetical protein n=1 Tax=Helicobacter cinaedi TaxID=213 RepID=UPI001F1D2C5E|nr:hypothetical protein [Helicobacter cinaedi]BDB67537.1 hypothetical protein Hc94105_1760 [Helicobacter cinaedi]